MSGGEHEFYRCRMKKPKLSVIENFVASFGTGTIRLVVSAPFERVPLLVQCQNEMIRKGTLTRPDLAVINCTMDTFSNEGLLSFRRGNWVRWIRL